METRRSPFLEKLMSYLSYAEIGALFLSALGLAFLYLHWEGSHQLLQVGFTALAMIYFLSAFTLPVDPATGPESDQRKGFMDSFAKTILRKVIYLGCAVSLFGLLFALLGRPGAGQLLLIGGTTLVLASLLAGLAVLSNNTLLAFLQGPLLRAVPLAMLAVYWLYAHWPIQN